MSGAPTIRAYRMLPAFIEENERLVDFNQVSHCIITYWIRFRYVDGGRLKIVRYLRTGPLGSQGVPPGGSNPEHLGLSNAQVMEANVGTGSIVSIIISFGNSIIHFRCAIIQLWYAAGGWRSD